MKEQFFNLLECATADGVTDCHSVALVHVPHVMVIINHSLWLFLPQCRNYLLLEQHEYSLTCKSLSCPATVLPSSQPRFLCECLPFSDSPKIVSPFLCQVIK